MKFMIISYYNRYDELISNGIIEAIDRNDALSQAVMSGLFSEHVLEYIFEECEIEEDPINLFHPDLPKALNNCSFSGSKECMYDAFPIPE